MESSSSSSSSSLAKRLLFLGIQRRRSISLTVNCGKSSGVAEPVFSMEFGHCTWTMRISWGRKFFCTGASQHFFGHLPLISSLPIAPEQIHRSIECCPWNRLRRCTTRDKMEDHLCTTLEIGTIVGYLTFSYFGEKFTTHKNLRHISALVSPPNSYSGSNGTRRIFPRNCSTLCKSAPKFRQCPKFCLRRRQLVSTQERTPEKRFLRKSGEAFRAQGTRLFLFEGRFSRGNFPPRNCFRRCLVGPRLGFPPAAKCPRPWVRWFPNFCRVPLVLRSLANFRVFLCLKKTNIMILQSLRKNWLLWQRIAWMGQFGSPRDFKFQFWVSERLFFDSIDIKWKFSSEPSNISHSIYKIWLQKRKKSRFRESKMAVSRSKRTLDYN